MSKKDIVEYATTELEGVAGNYYVIPASKIPHRNLLQYTAAGTSRRIFRR